MPIRVLALLCCASSALAGEAQWFGGVRLVPPGRWLDLDDGGLHPAATFPRGAAELAHDGALHPEDPRFDSHPGAPAWRRVETDLGQVAWYLVAPRPEGRLVRFWTCLRTDPDAGPRRPRIAVVGHGTHIVVHGVAAAASAPRFRIERAEGGGAFREIARPDSLPFEDADIQAGVRYGYRVFAVDAEGRESAPAEAGGTSDARGVRMGKWRLQHGRSGGFDLVAARACDRREADLVVDHVYERRAGFRDHFGTTLGGSLDEGRWRSPWGGGVRRDLEVNVGTPLVVPLRDGGVAVCRWYPTSERASIIEYEVFGDGPVLPPSPRVRFQRADDGVRISVTTKPPWRCDEVLAGAPGFPKRRPLQRGAYVDAEARLGEVREYRVVGVDRRGRRTLSSVHRVVALPGGALAHEVPMEGGDRLSLVTGRKVASADADLVFGGHGRPLHGARRIPREVLPRVATPREAFESLVAASRFDGGGPAYFNAYGTDAFVVRTSIGTWAKVLWIVESKDKARVWFVHNVKDPRFRDGAIAHARAGFRFAPIARIERRNRVLAAWRKGVGPVRSGSDSDGGEVPREAANRRVLLALQTYRRFPRAALYLTGGSGPGADLVYDGDEFRIRPARDDASTIVDLGRLSWRDVAQLESLPRPTRTAVAPRRDHVYLLRARDQQSARWALLRVVAYRDGRHAAVESVVLADDEVTAPADLSTETRAGLGTLLRDVDRRGRRAALRLAARARMRRAFEETLPAAGFETTLSTFARDLSAIANVRIAVDRAIGDRTVAVRHPGRVTLLEILDDVVASAGATWTLDGKGRVVIR